MCIPELELTRVAQLVTIGAELRQAHAGALRGAALRRRLQPDTRVTLACAARFTATDLLQARFPYPTLSWGCLGTRPAARQRTSPRGSCLPVASGMHIAIIRRACNDASVWNARHILLVRTIYHRLCASALSQAQKARTRALVHVRRLFREQLVDFVATPTVAVTAPEIMCAPVHLTSPLSGLVSARKI